MRIFSSLRLIPLLVFLVAFAAPSRAETPSEVPNPLQTRRSWVADNANVVSDEDERRISTILSPLERRTGAEVAIVTVHNLGGMTVEEFANDLFRRWGVGKKGRDNGVLVLAAIDEHKLRIEVGYGLEDKLTDGKAADIRRDVITPPFKRGEYGEGLYSGALAIAQEIDPSTQAPAAPTAGTNKQPSTSAPGAPPRRAPTFPSIPPPSRAPASPPYQSYPNAPSPSGGSGGVFVAVFGIIMMLCPLFLLGGIIWFVVSLFGRPPRCPRCKTPMQLIPDALEARSLSPIQQFEQQIGSRDYKVWHCPNCQHETISDHNNLFSGYDNCPACRNRTARSTVQTLQYPTEWQQGLEQVTVLCEWPACGHTGSYTRSTPRRPRHNSGTDFATGAVIGSVLGSSHSSNDSSSSGGWSSSNDSSSSSSSDFGGSSGGSSFDSGPSDFGGGDSGGGGSSGDW